MHEALYYEPDGQGVKCRLCPKHCSIGEGQTGFCRVRHCRGGKLYSANYAACSSSALDPIEKKPLYHFYPGSYILSLGTWGCNFSCRFCQNWQIAQADPATTSLTPDEAAQMAAGLKRNIGVAYTYSEPGVWYEYVLDTAKLVRAKGLKNVLVTNGFISAEPLAGLLPYIDALNIDVKSFNDRFYRQICAGRLDDVKRTVETASGAAHVEITCLVIPGLNDDADELTALAKWLAGINKNIPLHFSRYFPNYKLDTPPTPLATLRTAYENARAYLNYVYVGNVGTEWLNTGCPDCGLVVLDRRNQCAKLTPDKKCPQCGTAISITGEVKYEACRT